MFFHFGQGWIPGGYMGVDVFFVLSGFLITTILVQKAPERFDARSFWERRARRLFPALAVMLVVVFLFALIVPALEQSAIRGQGIATVFYVNNWWLLASGSEYFADFQSLSPLLHTWTLSVEEQWYVLLPLLLMLLIALKRFDWPVLIVTFIGLALISASWTVLLAARGASVDRLYLGTDTRAQQLLLGGLLGVIGARAVARGHSRIRFAGRWAGQIGMAGLVGLLAMFVFWPEGRLVAAQLPLAAVASVMLIIGALDPGAKISRWLSVRPLAAIGLISYGLYLWHWPIAVMIGDDQTNVATPVRLILTFAIATVSYIFLETPIRRGRVRLRWFLLLPVVLVALAVICTPKASEASYARALPEHAAPPFSGSGRTVFFVGDSVSGSMWLPAAGTPRNDIAVTGSFLLSCPLFDLDMVAGGATVKADEDIDCPAWEQQWRGDMESMAPDIGVFVGTSSWQFDVLDDNGELQPFGSEGYTARIRTALDEALGDFSADTVAITSVPCTTLPSNPVNDPKNDRRRTAFLNDLLRAYAQEHGYEFVDLGSVTCTPDPSGLYIDGLHFSPEGAREVWDRLRPQLLALP